MDVAKEAVEALQTEFKNGAQVRLAHMPVLEHVGPGTDGHVNALLSPELLWGVVRKAIDCWCWAATVHDAVYETRQERQAYTTPNAYTSTPRSGSHLSTRAEYLQICRAVATGFVIMGGIGYVVKLVHIPINNILVGGS